MLPTTEELVDVFEDWCAKSDDIRIVTAWATTDCKARLALNAARNAISTLIVGLDFYTTSPSFLDSFRSTVRIGRGLSGGTFHPKLYLFRSADKYCCIIGSSNFTCGGFGDNTELNICVEGKEIDPFFSQVSGFIDKQEEHSDEISSPEIDDYRHQFERFAASRARLANFRVSADAKAKAIAKKSKEAEGEEPPEQLNKIWQEFVKLILAQENRPGLVIQGLETAEHCHKLFAKYGRLSKMAIDDRRFVGGTIAIAGWFGSIRGSGLFKQRPTIRPYPTYGSGNQRAAVLYVTGKLTPNIVRWIHRIFGLRGSDGGIVALNNAGEIL